MKYVLDANVALRWVLNEEHSDIARALRDEFLRGIRELIAPSFFPIEVTHALTRAERRRLIPRGQAVLLLDDIMADCPVLVEPLPLLRRAAELSSLNQASIYDCIYLLLAEDQDCSLITADRKLLNSFPGEPRIVNISQL